MSKLLIAALSAMLFVTVGCQNKDEDMNGDMGMRGSSTASESRTAAGADACTHCAGKQTATAEGKCPSCGMKVK